MDKVTETFKKVHFILKPETSFYIASLVYGLGASILTLAIPISVQSLVNTVTFGVLTQPLIVLSIVLFSLLVFSGVLNALQTYIIELFQRHFYARVTTDFVKKLVNSDQRDLEEKNGTQLVNRYFDLMTIQKNVSILLTGGFAIILQTFVGLVLLAFYHPYFLVFDIILIASLAFIWSAYYKHAILSAIDESKAKYQVAGWLEELARVNMLFKNQQARQKAIEKSDEKICHYLDSRKIHFRSLFSQNVLLLAVYAVMSALVLGLGGFLVTKGQLTLGQLVAAELVVTVILASFSKSGKFFEAFYDLVAAADKIHELYALKEEKNQKLIPAKDNYELELFQCAVKHRDNNFYFNYSFLQNHKYFVYSKFFSGKLVLLDLINQIAQPHTGEVRLGGNELGTMSQARTRQIIKIIDEPQAFEGSLLENLRLGDKSISKQEIHQALEIVELSQLKNIFDKGLDMQISPSGKPLWSSQLIRLEVARAIIQKPKIIILTEVIDLIEESRREKILEYFTSQDCTIIYFSGKRSLKINFDKYLILEREKINEYATEKEMIENRELMYDRKKVG